MEEAFSKVLQMLGIKHAFCIISSTILTSTLISCSFQNDPNNPIISHKLVTHS